jgi:Lon protease-like protein
MTSVRAPIQLPSRIALLPLSGVILLPGGHIPLIIFEPRYINMIDDVLGQSRLIGIIQPRVPPSEPIANDASLFDVGSVGRIVQFADLGDGRYHITLEGVSRFRLQSALDQSNSSDVVRGYRTEMVDYSCFNHDLVFAQDDEGPGRDRILQLMRNYFATKGIDANWQAVSESPYEALISSLAMSCPFEATEKQALLECPTHVERAAMLISLFEMSCDGRATVGSFKH